MGALKMALVINGTSIPTSGKVVCNGTSLKQLNIGGTKVWNSGIDLIAANNWTKNFLAGWLLGQFHFTAMAARPMAYRLVELDYRAQRGAEPYRLYANYSAMGQQRRKRPELDRLWRVFYECESDAG